MPIAAIEQLANLESRLAESRGDAELAERALARLKNLDQMAAEPADDGVARTDKPGSSANVERASVIGSAYKRKAAIFANRIIAGDTAAATVKEFNSAVRAEHCGLRDRVGESDRRAIRSLSGAQRLGAEGA